MNVPHKKFGQIKGGKENADVVGVGRGVLKCSWLLMEGGGGQKSPKMR